MTLAHFFWNGDMGVGFPEMLWGMVGMVMSVAFWVLIVVLVIRLARGAKQDTDRSSVAVLEERYARGEISRDEFLERKAVLQGNAGQR